MCHHDTPSGTINPAVEIGRVVAAHGGFLLIDAVSSFGGMNIHPEDCASDIFVTAPQKCLGCPPGLTIMSVSDRAWAKMHANPLAPRASFLSILDWQNAWMRDKPFPFTPSVAEINALEAAIDLYLQEGPERVWARHGLTASACRAGVQAMGLSLWAAEERFASPTATAVRVPSGVEEAAWREAARATYGVLFSSGQGETKGKLVRIGHMGPNARPITAIVAVAGTGRCSRRRRSPRRCRCRCHRRHGGHRPRALMLPAVSLHGGTQPATLDARFRVPLMSFFLRRIRNRAEAEDLTQEVFVRLIGTTEPDRIKCAEAFVFRVATKLVDRPIPLRDAPFAERFRAGEERSGQSTHTRPRGRSGT